MYRSHFNLTEKPFKLTADPKFLWLGEKHKEALATLKYGVIDQKGFILVYGDVGTGKTTLINALLENIDENILVANIKDPALNLIDFLNFIAISFNIPQKFSNKVDFIVYFSQFLKKVYSENKCVLLIIDEVHSLSKELLEHIRLLSNIELPDEKLINIFFVGQNEIHQTLALPECRAIRQRISLAYQIKPLSESETFEYIKHRLKIAGTEKKIFTESAVREIYRFSNGYPRLVNIICDLSLLTGYSQDLKKITPDIVRECSQEYNFINTAIESPPSDSKVQHPPESGFQYVKCPLTKTIAIEETFPGRPGTQDMSLSQPAIPRESSKLNPFISRFGKWIFSRTAAPPFSWRLRKNKFFWATAVTLSLIVVAFAGFSHKEEPLKDRGQKQAVSEFIAPTASVAKANSHIIPGTPEKKITKVASRPSQKSPPVDASKTLKPIPFELAMKALEHKNFNRAIELFEQTMAQNPKNMSEIQVFYSKALREQAKTVLAKNPYISKKLLVKAVEVDPKNAGAFFDLGMLQTKSKDYKKAIIAYQEAANLNYRSSDAYYNLGFIYASTKDYATAEKMFLRVVDLRPQYLDKVLFNLAVVQQKQRKNRQCIENLEKAIKINPDNQRARQYLHRLKYDKGASK
jgi:type II secretory pathway predicted ATPase ExeA/TolA-binding protein